VVADRLVAAAPLPPSAQSPEVSRLKAQHILSQSQFKAAQPSVVQRVEDWVFQHLFGGVGGLGGWLVILVFTVVVVLVVLWITRGMQRDPARAVPQVVLDVSRSPAEWLADAEANEAAGRWKEGLRDRYRALVGELVLRRVMREQPGRTIGEHRVDVARSAPTAAPDFDAAAELFERAWYGDRPTGPEQRDRFIALAAALHHVRPAGEAADAPDDELVAP
jgi:hypothetical protein